MNKNSLQTKRHMLLFYIEKKFVEEIEFFETKQKLKLSLGIRQNIHRTGRF